MRRLSISCSSFLPEKSASWRLLSEYFNINFEPYGSWTSSLVKDNDADFLATFFFIDDIGTDERSIKNAIDIFLRNLTTRLDKNSEPILVGYSFFNQTNPISDSRYTNYLLDIKYDFIKNLDKLINKHNNLFKLDIDHQFSNIGFENAFDPRNWYTSRCRLSRRGLDLLGSSIAKIISRFFSSPSKVLVLDCDNTLWGGVIGEDGINNIELGSGIHGEIFLDFQKSIKLLAEQGVLLAIASKNNYNDVIEVFQKHPAMILKEEDIICWRVNWSEKFLNINEIASELSIGLDSIVFWDDNPIERNKMRVQIPQVSTIEMPNSIERWPSLIRTLDHFAKITHTKEDDLKLDQYKSRAKFIRDKSASNDLNSYLKSICMKPVSHNMSDENFARAEQLIHKTNQFNLRGEKYTAADLKRISLSKPDLCFLTSLQDLYGNHGLVSLIIMKEIDAHIAFIDVFVMSCRVMGRHLESWIINEAIRRAKLNGYSFLVGGFKKTEKNIAVKGLYSQHNFLPISEAPEFINMSFINADEELFFCNIENVNIPFLEAYD